MPVSISTQVFTPRIYPLFCPARRLILSRPNRLPLIFALSTIFLAYACSQESEQASEEPVAEVASVEAHIVYYAIPG